MRDNLHSLTLTDDLQIHLLQLNHLQVTAETVYDASPVERWAWFLSHADELTSDQVARLFPDQEFAEAAEVLKMIARNPQQYLEYTARLKAHRDEEARILYAQQQGRAEGIDLGISHGVLIGQIILLQRLLQLPTWTEQQCTHLSIDELQQLVVQLQQQFNAHRS